MEIFVIQCTTCRARLKVNDESVIGDILACPKCGNMVQVVPPAEWKRANDDTRSPEESSAAGGTAARVDWYNPPPERSKATAVPPALPTRPAQEQPTSRSATSQILPVLVGLAQGAESTTAGVAQQAPLASAPPPPLTIPPPLVAPPLQAKTSIWSLLAARARQDAALIGAGVAGGMLLGGSLWLALAIQAPPPEATAQARDATVVARSRPAVPPASTAAPPVDGTRPPPSPRQAIRSAAPGETNKTVPDESPPASPEKPAAGVELPLDVPPVAPVAENAPAARDVAPPGPTIRLDPVPAAVGGGTDTNTKDGPATDAPPSEPIATSDDEPADDPSDVQASGSAPGSVVESEGLARRVLSNEEIKERLSQALPGVEFAEVPLAKFVRFIADVSGLTVVIDVAALEDVGLSRQSPVTIKLTDTTAGAALGEAVARLGLGCVIGDGQVLVTVVKRAAPAK